MALDALPPLPEKYQLLLEQLVEFAVVAAIVFVLGRLLLVPLVRFVTARRAFDPTLDRAIAKLVRVGVIVAAIVIAAGVAGFTAFLGGSALVIAALTLAVGFAAQDVLSNFVAGVFIVQDPNFNLDDWIEWEGNAGFIEDIGFRVTRVRTFDNETITVPNTELATTAVTNRMSNERLRISATFGIGFDDDIDAAAGVLLDTADALEDVLDDPEPTIRIVELADNAIVLQARLWIENPDREAYSRIRSDYVQTATERCAAAGIDLSTTTQHDLRGDIGVERRGTAE